MVFLPTETRTGLRGSSKFKFTVEILLYGGSSLGQCNDMPELRATLPGYVPVADHARLIQVGGGNESPKSRIVVVVRVKMLTRAIASPRSEDHPFVRVRWVRTAEHVVEQSKR